MTNEIGYTNSPRGPAIAKKHVSIAGLGGVEALIWLALNPHTSEARSIKCMRIRVNCFIPMYGLDGYTKPGALWYMGTIGESDRRCARVLREYYGSVDEDRDK